MLYRTVTGKIGVKRFGGPRLPPQHPVVGEHCGESRVNSEGQQVPDHHLRRQHLFPVLIFLVSRIFPFVEGWRNRTSGRSGRSDFLTAKSPSPGCCGAHIGKKSKFPLLSPHRPGLSRYVALVFQKVNGERRDGHDTYAGGKRNQCTQA